MTFTLAVGVIFYQDAAGLIRLIRSLKPLDSFISSIYAVDGRFVGPDYGSNEDPELSTDLINFDSDKLKIISLPNKKEWHKRQAYIEECYHDRPDFLLVVDSDEYIQEDLLDLEIDSLEHFKRELELIKQNHSPAFIHHNVYDILFVDNVEKMYNTKPRLWFRPYQMEYIKNLNYRNTQYTNFHTDPTGSMYALELIRGIKIVHDKTIRSKDYEIKNREYHKRLVASIP
jgi:hypothetical protein